jgi:hypothetical protein
VIFAVVTEDGGIMREQVYGAISPETTLKDVELLAGICHNTVMEELPAFLEAK